jgi:hypothetical protein
VDRHRIQKQDRPSKTPLGSHQLLGHAAKALQHIDALCQALHLRRRWVARALNAALLGGDLEQVPEWWT